MKNKHRTTRDVSNRRAINGVVAPTPQLELVKLLDIIEQLQMVLYRFGPLLDSESVEVAALIETAVKTLTAAINCVVVLQNTQNSQEQLQNWDNEGGRTKFVSV